MKYKHYLVCEAAICAGDENPNYKEEVIWYAGEPVCTKEPYSKFQKKQFAINRDKHFRHFDTPYTALDLETKSI